MPGRSQSVVPAGEWPPLNDGSQAVIEMDGTGPATAVNTFGANGLLSRRTGGVNGSTIFYTFDPQGNVSQRFGNQGALLSSDEYDAWGARLGTTQTGTADVIGAGGQWGYYTDGGTGLLLLTNRYYDPGTRRFVTRDPIGYAGGINLYGYVGNGPVSFADPLGLQEECPCENGAGKPLDLSPAGAEGEEDPDHVLDEPGMAPVVEPQFPGSPAALEGQIVNGNGVVKFPPSVYQSLGLPVPVEVPGARFPEAAGHIREAQEAGQPTELTVDKPGAPGRRSQSLRGCPPMPGMDRDEYPPAATSEGGHGASVQYIKPGDNRGAGAYFGAQIRGLPNGTKIKIIVKY